MAIKWGTVLTHAVIIGLLIAIIVLLSRQSRSYMTAAPIVTTPGPNASKDTKSLLDRKPSLDCTPGPGESASYYSMGLTPGGLCGDGDYVHDQIRDFAIADGIGGSLLEKS